MHTCFLVYQIKNDIAEMIKLKKKKKKEIKNSKSRGDPQKTTTAKQIKKIFVNGKNLGINKNEKKKIAVARKSSIGAML